MQSTATVQETMVKLVPGGERDLSHLSDAELLVSTRRLVATSNKLFAALLLHLAQVEVRGIHRQRACASLYTYCIYELRMSEDAAARRSSAARLVKAFPRLLDAIAAGELHLTGVLMLGPHLTPENHVDVLARAKFRTKKELAKLVRELHPLPQVPDQMEALGPEPSRMPNESTWREWLTSLGPPCESSPRMSAQAPGRAPAGSAATKTTQTPLAARVQPRVPTIVQPNLAQATTAYPRWRGASYQPSLRLSSTECNSAPLKSTCVSLSVPKRCSPALQEAARSASCTSKPCSYWSRASRERNSPCLKRAQHRGVTRGRPKRSHGQRPRPGAPRTNTRFR